MRKSQSQIKTLDFLSFALFNNKLLLQFNNLLLKNKTLFLSPLKMQQKFQQKYAPLSNNETYAYREAGTSDNILLLVHGTLASSYYFEPLLTTFSKDYRVIAPDLRGYGHTTNNRTSESIDDLVEDIKLFVDHLKIEKFALLGWSLGGGLSMKFAARYPSYVKKLILFHAIGVKGFPEYLEDQNGESTKRRVKNFRNGSSQDSRNSDQA